jgi:hypothetical protein
MNTRSFNLVLMLFWIAIAIGLLTRELWMPQNLKDKMNIEQMPLIIGVAFMLAGWNLMRYFAARSRSSPVQVSEHAMEIRRKIRASLGPDPKVTDPQFDFENPHSSDPPK